MANSHSGDIGSRWRIWSVIDELQSNGLSSSSNSHNSNNKQYDDMIQEVIQILTLWGVTWAGQDGFAHLLDKTTLYHEVEESIIALHFLVEWLQQRNEQTAITLVDACCGKGILSMLATYLFRDKTETQISNIIMLDKQEDINWNHIKAANEHAKEERRPTITSWGGCNLHEIDTIVDKLETDTTEPLAIIGIHLCKQLSPACVGVVNALGKKKCPYVCLAPCCLPRMVRNLSKAPNSGMIPNRGRSNQMKKDTSSFTIPVRVYESLEERQARKEANKRREMAKKRTFRDVPCYLCSEMHSIHKCNLLPANENERLDIFQKAQLQMPCWKCGEIGHMKKDCPSTQSSSKPGLILPPTIELDIASIIDEGEASESKGPFEKYSQLLATSIQRSENIKVVDVGLVNSSAQHNNRANGHNWNKDRKSLFIVAS